MDGGSPQTIVPRQGPAFAWQDVPRWWFDNDPFKTRFFDAMSLLFPEGEKFFIACVRDYRDDITDPQLRAQVKDFMYRSEEHKSELQSLMRISYAVFCLKKKK